MFSATCRCFKRLNTNYWNLQPYTNISRSNSFQGLYPYLLEMVTLSCCQNCLEHGTSEVIYDRDGEGNPSRKTSDNNVKRNLSLATDFSFPVYGFYGQEWYSKYFGYVPLVDVVGTVFFTKKPDYSTIQGNALLASVLSIMPFLAITMIFAYIAGVIMWALVSSGIIWRMNLIQCLHHSPFTCKVCDLLQMARTSFPEPRTTRKE